MEPTIYKVVNDVSYGNLRSAAITWTRPEVAQLRKYIKNFAERFGKIWAQDTWAVVISPSKNAKHYPKVGSQYLRGNTSKFNL